jgi:hypothetical protein
MRGTTIIAGAALLLGIGLTSAQQPQLPPVDPKAKQFKVQGKFTENLSDDGGKEEKATRVPALFIVEGRRLVYRSGGAVGVVSDPAVGAVPAATYGLSLQLTVTRLGSDDLLLDLAVDNTQLLGDPNKVGAAKSSSVHGTRKAKLGRPLRIVLEEDSKGAPRQWLDLTVVEADD